MRVVAAASFPGSTDLSVLRPKPGPLPPLDEEDEDVARERERVTKGATKGDVLVLRDLTKVGTGWGQAPGRGWHGHSVPSQEAPPLQVYRGQKSPAVDRLCLGIPPGEVSLGQRAPCWVRQGWRLLAVCLSTSTEPLQ